MASKAAFAESAEDWVETWATDARLIEATAY